MRYHSPRVWQADNCPAPIPEDQSRAVLSNWRDLGHGHRIQITQPDAATGIRHFVDEHKRPDNGLGCCGSGRILEPGQDRPPDGDDAYWALEAEEPLTLSPSLLCTECGDHGFVSEGKWRPA